MWNRIWDYIKQYLNWRWMTLVVLILGSAYTFLDLAGDVWLQEGFDWDEPIMLLVHSFSSPTLDVVFLTITYTANELSFVPVLICGIWWWRTQRRDKVIQLMFSWLGMGAIINSLKLLFQRARPSVFPPLMNEISYSFPSGHTGTAVAVYGLIGVFLWEMEHPVWAVACWIWVGLVALSRVYLGVHYPSDVLASLTLGTLWVILIVLRSRRQDARQVNAPD
ncbi:MAG: phosphatase PAP2 family protein [Anaerolineae bacterium]|nr:phosphatase PAP2 family protein [Anaerolineae bacterium]